MARTMLVACLVLVLGLEHSYAAIVGTLDIAALQAGVVRITATPSGEPQKIGTGFIVRLERDVAYIVTAAHVIAGDAQPKVQFFTQQDVSVHATVRHSEGGDEVTGLALLVVRGKSNLFSGLTALRLASTSRLSGNEEIIVIGHPRGAGDWAILKGGIASRQGRYVTVDANIDEGNSGGPIIHGGEVVGLVGGVTRYGRGVTAGSVREYLEGHGINTQEAPPTAVAKVQPTPSIPIEPQMPKAGQGREIGQDGAPMVLIPAGEFMMGSPDDEGDADEHPRHRVYLEAYSIDRFEVSVSRYAEFMQSAGWQAPAYWGDVKTNRHGNLPIVGIDWQDAVAYCRWDEKRLPTEAEWEKAARGSDGRTYPWGNEEPTTRLANFGKESTQKPYDERLAPEESYEAGKSLYGLHHMAGNVWEWTADWYDKDFYSKSPSRNPTGPSSATTKVIRGGSWRNNGQIDLRSADRHRVTPTSRYADVGFRCAQDSPK